MYNVMIVEDSKPILRNIKMLLETLSFPIRVAATATNGEEALAAIKQSPIDLLLTDIRMPKMDGLSLIEQAKIANPDLKVILISGYSDFEYTRKALNLQVFDYLLKPVEREALEEVMGRVIDQLDQQMSKELLDLQEIIHPQCETTPKQGEAFPPLFSQMMIIMSKQPFTAGHERWVQVKLEGIVQDFLHSILVVYTLVKPHINLLLLSTRVHLRCTLPYMNVLSRCDGIWLRMTSMRSLEDNFYSLSLVICLSSITACRPFCRSSNG